MTEREAELERYIERLRAEKSGLAKRFSDKRDRWRKRADELEDALRFTRACLPSDHPAPCGEDACWLCAAEATIDAVLRQVNPRAAASESTDDYDPPPDDFRVSGHWAMGENYR